MANIATEQSRGECTVHGLQWALNLQQAKFGRMIFMCIIIIITIFCHWATAGKAFLMPL